MKLFLSITFILFSILSNLKANAQGHYPVIAMELQTTAIAGNVQNGIPDISDSTTFNVVMKIIISDTLNINNLQILLRKEINEPSNLISKTFTYDVSGTFPDGTSYIRNGYEVTINLGNFQGTITPYAELVINTQNSTSDPIIYF